MAWVVNSTSSLVFYSALRLSWNCDETTSLWLQMPFFTSHLHSTNLVFPPCSQVNCRLNIKLNLTLRFACANFTHKSSNKKINKFIFYIFRHLGLVFTGDVMQAYIPLPSCFSFTCFASSVGTLQTNKLKWLSKLIIFLLRASPSRGKDLDIYYIYWYL